MPIYDSLNKTNVNFPSQNNSASTLKNGMGDYISSSSFGGTRAKTKRDGQEQLIIKQSEKDLLKLKEKMLQSALDKERRREPVVDAFA